VRQFSFRTVSHNCNPLSDWLKIIIKPSVQEFVMVIIRFLYSKLYYYSVIVLFIVGIKNPYTLPFHSSRTTIRAEKTLVKAWTFGTICFKVRKTSWTAI